MGKYHEEFTKLRAIAGKDDRKFVIARYEREIRPQIKMLEDNAVDHIYVVFTYDRYLPLLIDYMEELGFKVYWTIYHVNPELEREDSCHIKVSRYNVVSELLGQSA